MGILETALRKNVKIGQMLDITLIGGKELRGQVMSYAEDGLYLFENGYERPVAFAGIATYLPTELVQPDFAAEQAKKPENKANFVKKPEPEEIVTQEEGWIERYETAAGVGSITCGEKHAVFALADVLDQQLADALAGWYGRPIAVQCTLRVKGALVTATGITERRTQEKFIKPEKEEVPAERHGFGEILHFDKQNGFGKACEGDVKFIFKRADIASDTLWQEIISSSNTCGIKIAFTAVQEEGRVKYTCLREIAALQSPDDLEKPDFDAVIPMEEEEDINPFARVTFTDGTEMSEEVHAGYVMFYNADKNFGRLQKADDGERYYFRANDVMQKTLMDHLNRAAITADTPVTFSIKKLPTGKEAAGRVTWEAPRPTARKPVQPVAAPVTEKEAEKPEKEAPVPAQAQKKAEPQQMNLYCEMMCKLWNVPGEELSALLCAAAEKNENAAEDLLLENVALSDVRREKRDNAMLRYLKRYVQEGGGEQLSSFLTTATYNGKEMFDALTRLFAVSDGAYGRLCGIIASGGDAVTLRGEILMRLGQVPETASALRELWRPLVEEERAKTAFASLLHSEAALKEIDPEGAKSDWAKAAALCAKAEAGEPIILAEAMQLVRSLREGVKQEPTRAAVEWLLPMLEKIEQALEGQEAASGLAMRALCSVTSGGTAYACVEITGGAAEVTLSLGENVLSLGDVDGSLQAAIPCAAEKAEVRLAWNGGEILQEMEFAPMAQERFDAQQAQKLLEERGVAVLRGGAAAELKTLAEALRADADCAVIEVAAAQEEAELLESTIKALEAGLKEKFGAETIGLIGFPLRTENLSAEALREALLSALRDFGDVRLLHDRLKGAYIALLADAGQHGEAFAGLAAEMMENGVHTVIAASADAGTAAEITLDVCPDTVADRLRAAGFAAEDVRI